MCVCRVDIHGYVRKKNIDIDIDLEGSILCIHFLNTTVFRKSSLCDTVDTQTLATFFVHQIRPSSSIAVCACNVVTEDGVLLLRGLPARYCFCDCVAHSLISMDRQVECADVLEDAYYG
jgi:hypothetical protein